jgi:hypothetical protein
MSTNHPMERALDAWLHAVATSQDTVQAAMAAAEAIATEPWAVIEHAGALARAQLSIASKDLGLTIELRVKDPAHPDVIATVPKGAPFPAIDISGRRKRGAFDTPQTMARHTTTMALAAARRTVNCGLDPACGTGAFLVAMSEAGVHQIAGFELDPVAAAIARVAAPTATITIGDGFTLDGSADIVVGNPPFIPPERQNKSLRARLVRKHTWLTGRFDLSVPFAATAVQRAHTHGGVGLVLPASLMVQPYATPLRKHWVEQHHIREISKHQLFPGAAVEVVSLSMTTDAGPAPLPDHGLSAESLLSLETVPLQPSLRPGDPELIARIRAASVPLGSLATVDTGVVSHGPLGGKEALLHDTPAPERVPYVDARDLAKNRTRWLEYRPEQMHRAKSPDLFDPPKVLVQRLRGRGRVRAWIDRSGLYAGHTLTVIRPNTPAITPETIHALVTDPMVDGLIRIEHGSRLDLYPKDVRGIPVPTIWIANPDLPLAEAWGIDQVDADRLTAFPLE